MSGVEHTAFTITLNVSSLLMHYTFMMGYASLDHASFWYKLFVTGSAFCLSPISPTMPSVLSTQYNSHLKSLPFELHHLIVHFIPLLSDHKEACQALLYLALSAKCFTLLALDELWGHYQHSLIPLLHVLDHSLWMK